MQRVGLLTGTFDPVHLGHVALAWAAMRSCDLAEVWFLVNPAPGHKTGVAPLADRLAMVRLALEGEDGLREGDPKGVGAARHRMADFERLMGCYPDREFVFIVGSDVLAVMADWEDREPALERAAFAVARRAGTPEVQIDPRLQVQMFEVAEHAAASSRRVQEQLAAGERPVELDARVFEYVREKGLYSIRISSAVPDDAPGIAAVQHEAWLVTYPNEELGITRAYVEERVQGYQSPERIAKWRSIIGDVEEYVVVAKDGQRVVGFSCAKKGEDVNEMAALYVLPQYHGTGVAQQLMGAAMAWLGDGLDVSVEVASYNERAIAFYEKCGFVLTGETSSSGEIPTVFMRRAKLPIS